MSKTVWWLIAIFGAGLIALIIYHALPKPQPEPPAVPPVVAPPAPKPLAEPQIRYPVEPPPQEKPLPALDTSDATVKSSIDELLTDGKLAGLLHLKDFIRHVVATIDNLPRSKLALRLLPVKSAPGKFLVTGKDDSLAISPDNAARYAAYVRLADAIDSGKLVALYVHLYPLFQQAYQDLGYPKGYFNDRLIEAIDDLLAAPEVKTPVQLVQPKVFYQFADPALESRSAGQKILMRIGGENASKIKAKLREIRGLLVHADPQKAVPGTTRGAPR